MDVLFVYMSADKKRMIALRKFQRGFVCQTVSALRRNFAYLVGLNEQIGDHIFPALLPAPGQIFVKLFCRVKFLVGIRRIALIPGNQSALIGLFRVHAVIQTLVQRAQSCFAVSPMKRADF